ncbi:MAG: hypothetical protein K0U98_15965 [Deltaproteobacteria bacterium]|nr:hypothetical protein [Deltaproteobacteria bacterium]
MHRKYIGRGCLLLCLSVLAITSSVRGDLKPPEGCSDCGNYLRYGFITADLAGWTVDEGSWSVLAPFDLFSSTTNTAWPTQTNAAGYATLFQKFKIPSFILGESEPPAPSKRYWVAVNYRMRHRFSRSTTVDLDIIDGSGLLVFSEKVEPVSIRPTSSLFGPFELDIDPADNELTFWLTAYGNNVLLDDLAFWVEDTQDQSGYCQQAPLSSTGLAVRNRLNQLALSGDNYFSQLTTCNNLPGEENPFPRGWLNDNPDVESPPTSTDSESFYQAIGDEIRKTSSTFVLSSLHFDGRPLDGGGTLVGNYLTPAVQDLSDRFAGVDAAFWPSVRILLSSDRTTLSYPSAESVYQQLTQSSGQEEPLNVRLSVAEVGRIPYLAWNHTKIAVRDRQFGIVGGQNWEKGYIQPEAGAQDLYDLNIRIQGDAARAADGMFEKLWSRRYLNLPSPPYPSNGCAGFYCFQDKPPFPHVPPVGDYSGLNVFALGRGHKGPYPWPSNLDQSADLAVVTAISSANESIDISQHQLHLIYGFADIVWNAIFDRMLEEPIEVRVVVSDPWGAPPSLSVETQASLATSIFLDLAQQTGLSEEERNDVLCRLHWAPFRATGTDPDFEMHTHNKFWRIDNRAFYIGSQNLYPSAIGQSSGSDLNEFGFMVDDSAFAQQVGAEYFDVFWQRADQQGAVFRSPLVDGLCAVVEPGPEVCDGVDNDLNGLVDENNVCSCVFKTFGGSSYWFCNTSVTWDAAKAACEALEGNLVKLETASENLWIDINGGALSRWIGLTDQQVEGDWRWTDGTAASGIFLHWSEDEPNGGSNENCAMQWNGGYWNDLACDWTVPFLCEAAASSE